MKTFHSNSLTFVIIFLLGIIFFGCENESGLILPDPRIVLQDTEEYATPMGMFTRYIISVENAENYPDEIFSESSDLPSCGHENHTARTWVEIYNQDKDYIYSFCELNNASSLQKLWFSVPAGEAPPESICIKIIDRQAENDYFSNEIKIHCPSLPDPVLIHGGKETYRTKAGNFVRYRISVDNWALFPDLLFYEAPDLDPCGLNASASRTWLEIFDENDEYLNGFCALGQSSELSNIWFSIPEEEKPPLQVYVKLMDRRCGVMVQSTFLDL